MAIDLSPLEDVVRSDELTVGLAAALCLGVVVALGRGSLAGPVLASAVVLATWGLDVASAPVLLLVVLVALAEPPGSALRTPAAVSVVAAAAMYTCVPDTERALVLLGAVGGVAICAAVFRWPWAPAGAAVGVSLGWIAVVDGSTRDSAIAGGLGIVAIHLVGQRSLRTGTGVAVDLVVVAATAVGCLGSARVTGMDTGTLAPAVWTAVVVGATAAIVAVTRSASRAGGSVQP